MTAPAPAAPGNNSTIIIGAGPAGLTAAYELARAGQSAVVLEQDPLYVGGIARTVCYKGFRFDIGGHRFFSKNSDIEELWTTILGDQMVERQRLSRIFIAAASSNIPLSPSTSCGNSASMKPPLASPVISLPGYAHAAHWSVSRIGSPTPSATASSTFFSQLYRKGLGHPLQSAQRRLGCPAYQRPFDACFAGTRFQSPFTPQWTSDQNPD